MTERNKMKAGDWYCCQDDELEAMRMSARRAVHQHNSGTPDIRGAMGADLSSLLASIGQGVFIEAPIHIGDGAGSVVIHDVPPGNTAVGTPARIM